MGPRVKMHFSVEVLSLFLQDIPGLFSAGEHSFYKSLYKILFIKFI